QLPAEFRISDLLGINWRHRREPTYGVEPFWMMIRRISVRPKSPTASATMLTPWYASRTPKVNRASPLMASSPSTPSSRPKASGSRPAVSEPPMMRANTRSPPSVSAKYSADPNTMATWATGPATILSTITLPVPPMNEAIAVMPRAGPARPDCASGYPSKADTTEGASPGILSRTDVVDPPYMMP